jgi:hypothetical protein
MSYKAVSKREASIPEELESYCTVSFDNRWKTARLKILLENMDMK